MLVLALLFLSIVSWWILGGIIVARLRDVHPRTYLELGEPKPFWNDWRTAQLFVWVVLGEYGSLQDPTLLRICRAARVLSLGVLTLFPLFLLRTLA